MAASAASGSLQDKWALKLSLEPDRKQGKSVTDIKTHCPACLEAHSPESSILTSGYN